MKPRKQTWEVELNRLIIERRNAPFEWGSNDCALWAADAVRAMTGEDPAPDFRSVYSDQTGAREALREYGEGTLLKTYQARFDEKPTSMAMRGDLIWNGFAIGVCYGEFALFVGEPGGSDGLVRVPKSEWKRAFAV